MTTTVTLTSAGLDRAAPGAMLAVPFYEGPAGPVPGPGAAEAARLVGAGLTGADLAGMLARQGFGGRPGDAATFLVPDDGAGAGAGGPRRIAAVGVGPSAAAGAPAVRDAAQRLAALAAGSPAVATTLALLGPDRAESVRAAAEGFLLGGYRVPRSGSRPVPGSQPAPAGRLALVTAEHGPADGARPASGDEGTGAADPGGGPDERCADALRRGTVTGTLANWARDLVHAPPGEATPAMLAETIAARAARCGAVARVWTAAELAEAGFGGVTGVGQGSHNAPRMVEVSWAGERGPGGPAGRADGLIALAGKGITFDSGGLNLKRDPAEIAWMRSDMAGGAAVAAAVIAAAELGLAVPVTAVVPLAENMPGGGALRPGDVLTHRGGRTSQVVDTDSEGRLVVADALAYLAERGPAVLLDVATLTDAAGLGPALWAAFGTDQALLDEVLRAGEAAGDPGWPLPLPDAYRDLLACPAADLRNTPSRGPDSAVMAAMFLREFAGDAPWVHIDNGSTAWLEYETGLWPEGATGSPFRALLRFLEARAAY